MSPQHLFSPEGIALAARSCHSLFAHLTLIKRLRRQIIAPLFRIADVGLPGFIPLRTHILICGFPRSGTTLLQMMLENGIPHARRFGREVGAWRAATYAWRNHSVVISKVPQDVFRLNPLRNFYANRPANLKIILMVRDPRDVLTSERKIGGPEGYCVTPMRWLEHFRAFTRHQNDPDVLVVRYEDLVSDTAAQQTRIEQFTTEPIKIPFTDFHSIDRPDFQTNTLNGVRPVENSLIARWSDPQHYWRIGQVLQNLPELPQLLTQLGYEPNDQWTAPWQRPQLIQSTVDFPALSLKPLSC